MGLADVLESGDPVPGVAEVHTGVVGKVSWVPQVVSGLDVTLLAWHVMVDCRKASLISMIGRVACPWLSNWHLSSVQVGSSVTLLMVRVGMALQRTNQVSRLGWKGTR